MKKNHSIVRGRFAPTPSGRMHLGNIFTALLVWLDIRTKGGQLLLRIEDLDKGRCRTAYIDQMLYDLQWLGLDWDTGYFDENCTEYLQSKREERYQNALEILQEKNLIYPCYCNRKERMIANAPHDSDGVPLYHGRCRTISKDEMDRFARMGRSNSFRIAVPAVEITFRDEQYGMYTQMLHTACGDMILRRADDIFAYQLAVVVDDAEMGVNRVVRGRDLLASTPRQLWLMEQLGYEKPQYCHCPLLADKTGRRLSKRDGDLTIEALQSRTTAEKVIGYLAFQAGLIDDMIPIQARELLNLFSWEKVGTEDRVIPSKIAFLDS